MVAVILDGQKIADKEQLHELFRKQLELPDYYGENLDALYDVLSTYSEAVEITILHKEQLCSNVPFYGERLLSMLQIAAEENESYIFVKMGEDNMEEELW